VRYGLLLEIDNGGRVGHGPDPNIDAKADKGAVLPRAKSDISANRLHIERRNQRRWRYHDLLGYIQHGRCTDNGAAAGVLSSPCECYNLWASSPSGPSDTGTQHRIQSISKRIGLFGAICKRQVGVKRTALLALCTLACSHSTMAGTGRDHQREDLGNNREVQHRPSSACADQINGQAFPDRVLALTWDDGPDVHTVELARYLQSERVSATFFVVNEWQPKISSDPGEGSDAFQTGYKDIAVLADLVALGHRVGNHSLNHVLLTKAPPVQALEQIAYGQRAVDPFASNEQRLFRAPGGSWNNSVATAADSDPSIQGALPPIRWDVDRKDWMNSIECNSDRPRIECEWRNNRWRVKAAVTARRYVDSVLSLRHGIVLLHDRVGDVGSRYALDLARILVPALKSRGFVFAAPVLRFSPLAERVSWTNPLEAPALIPSTLRLAKGTGHVAYLCGESNVGAICVPPRHARPTSRVPFSDFGGISVLDVNEHQATMNDRNGSRHYGDINGDGAVDYCEVSTNGIDCRLGSGAGQFVGPTTWSVGPSDGPGVVTRVSPDVGRDDTDFWLTDIDGNGRADLCGWTGSRLVCALSNGSGFAAMTAWLSGNEALLGDGELSINRRHALEFGDINGDGRDDVCWSNSTGVTCALSVGNRFDQPTQWSGSDELGTALRDRWYPQSVGGATLRLGDLNGDGYADLCGRSPLGIVCALSTGHEFLAPTLWLDQGMRDTDGWLEPRAERSIELVDLNGDGRADLCGVLSKRVLCAIAP
jgi:peptidoglycan/xylan/chitin deacetylase (PgdA/CDA1 family)